MFKRDVFGTLAELLNLDWDNAMLENIGFFLRCVTKNLDTKNIDKLKCGAGQELIQLVVNKLLFVQQYSDQSNECFISAVNILNNIAESRDDENSDSEHEGAY